MFPGLKTLDWFEKVLFHFCFHVVSRFLIIKDVQLSNPALLSFQQTESTSSTDEKQSAATTTPPTIDAGLIFTVTCLLLIAGEFQVELQADYHTARTRMETTGCLQGGEMHE